MLKNIVELFVYANFTPSKTPKKTTTLHLCADTLNISNIKQAIGDVMGCVLTSSAVVDRMPNHKL